VISWNLLIFSNWSLFDFFSSWCFLLGFLLLGLDKLWRFGNFLLGNGLLLILVGFLLHFLLLSFLDFFLGLFLLLFFLNFLLEVLGSFCMFLLLDNNNVFGTWS
jgi:hypothetical protein